MPAKNRIKLYVPGAYYHVYNRGVDKRTIFQDAQDYNVFISYLKTYLLEKDIASLNFILCDDDSTTDEKDRAIKELNLNNFCGKIQLLAYCLISNHFHFFLRQDAVDDMDHFMNSLCTRYSMYFNRKYGRVGPLFQGVYKAVMVDNDEQMIYLSRYIHRNPVGTVKVSNLNQYHFSSYPDYLNEGNNKVVNISKILELFNNKREDYKAFVEEEFDVEQEITDYSLESTYIDK